MANDRRDSSSFPTATCDAKGHITMCKPPVTFLKPAPRRMCQECILKNWKSRDCNREHFHKVFHENPDGKRSSLNPDLDTISQLTCIPGFETFQRKIDLEEDRAYVEEDRACASRHHKNLSQRYLMNLLKIEHAINVKHSLPPLPFYIMNAAKSEIAPSGPFHLAMMFGPLIFESGTPR